MQIRVPLTDTGTAEAIHDLPRWIRRVLLRSTSVNQLDVKARITNTFWGTRSSAVAGGSRIPEINPSTSLLGFWWSSPRLYFSRTRPPGYGTTSPQRFQSCLPTSSASVSHRLCTRPLLILASFLAICTRCRSRTPRMTLWQLDLRQMIGSWSSWQPPKWLQWMCR